MKHYTLTLIWACVLYSCNNTVNNSPYRTWNTYSGDPSGSKFSELDQINTNNVGDLKVAWTYDTDDHRSGTTIQCNPIIIDRSMYLSTPGLKAVCLDAKTGDEKWRFDPYEGKTGSGVNRGMTYWEENGEGRILYVAGSHLYALDAHTGEKISDFGNGGLVDLYEGLGRNVRHKWVTATTPGIIFENIFILGSTLGDGPTGAAPGHIRAYDVRTGEIQWTFRTIPHPGEYGYDTWPKDAYQRIGGANAWGGFTLDEERGIVFCGTGSASYDHYGGDRIGTNLFANCILALDARTGKRKWHFQTVHHDIWDYDLPCPPNLVQVQKNGRLIDAVAQPTKMGHLFVLNRETGEAIFPIEERPVPPSNIPGEQSWPTQPFPPKNLQYAQQRFTLDNVTDLNTAATEDIKKQIAGMQLGDIFLPPSFEGAVTLPQFNGGSEWSGASFDPYSRTLYLNASNELEWISMVKSTSNTKTSQFELGRKIYGGICGTCHGGRAAKNPGSPSLDGLREIAKKQGTNHILTILQHGKGAMPAFTALSKGDQAAVAAFLGEKGKDIVLEDSDLSKSFSQQVPYISTGHREIKDPEGFPANKRPWGVLNAIDLDKGEIKWQVPLGTYAELEKRGLPPTGTFNIGGPVATAGGLIFIGATMDERFRAFEAATGKVLWEFQLSAGAYSTPSTYEVDGRQYVVIAAGGAGKPKTKAGFQYYCFALP